MPGEVVTRQRAEQIRAERVRRVQRALQAPGRGPVSNGVLAAVGSGFFITGGGRVLTNWHIVSNCDAVSVEVPNGDRATAQIEASDPLLDLALLETGLVSRAYAAFRVQSLTAGGPTGYAGRLSGRGLAVDPAGGVFGTLLPRPAGDDDAPYLTFKAQVRPGNSGGPLLDEAGLVVGVVSAKIDTVKVYREQGRLVRDLGVAIASDRRRRVPLGSKNFL